MTTSYHSRARRTLGWLLASLTAVSVLGAAPAADARPRKPGTTQKSSCMWGGKRYSHGATKLYKTRDANGKTVYDEYECQNGTWVKIRRWPAQENAR